MIGEDGRPVRGADSAVTKHKVCMVNGRFADGRPQSLYYAEGPRTGVFKGMGVIWRKGASLGHSKFALNALNFSARRGPFVAAVGECCSTSPTSLKSSPFSRRLVRLGGSKSYSSPNSIAN